MNCWKPLVLLSLLVSSGVAFGQEMSAQGSAAQQAMEAANRQAAITRGQTLGVRDDEQWSRGMVTLSAARKSLAQEWQKLGLSPEMATTVANTYRADRSTLLNHPPLEGRSDKEISGMIQEALASKNYRMANQLLIDFERKKLHAEPVAQHPLVH